MSTPEQRFEVPPEYAEVYERAYRRAYDEGHDALEAAPRATRSGEVGSSARPGKRARREPERARRLRQAPRQRAGGHARRHRAERRSTALPLVGVVALMVVLLVGSFVLGRQTAPESRRTTSGERPGGEAATDDGVNPTDSTTYAGAKRVVAVRSVSSDCAALPGSGSRGSAIADNVLDDDPTTAWRCGGVAVGEQLRLTLPAGTRVVQVGILPGLARSDPSTGADDYATHNRVSRVRWDLGDGVAVTQELGSDPQDRSLRTLVVPPTTTTTVRLTILGVDRGRRDQTAISTVRLWAAS